MWAGLEDGTITVAFRRWKRPTVRAGGTLQSPGGLLAIEAVDEIEERQITDADARAAGYISVADVVGDLRPEGTLYRIRFHRLGEDPRIVLRNRADLDADELERLRVALARLPWAGAVLRRIAGQPAVVSTELAAAEGVERHVFKQRVRKLKSLGLTESLDVGYRLSPRGEAVLAALPELARVSSEEDAGRA